MIGRRDSNANGSSIWRRLGLLFSSETLSTSPGGNRQHSRIYTQSPLSLRIFVLDKSPMDRHVTAIGLSISTAPAQLITSLLQTPAMALVVNFLLADVVY